MLKIRKDKLALKIIYIILAWLVITFLYFPNLNLFNVIFYRGGELSFRAFTKLFSSPRAMKSLLNSFILASSAIVTVNIVGIFSVFVTEYFDIKGAKWLKLAYMSPLVYRGIVLISGYKFVYGSTGLITKFLTSIFPNMNPDWFNGYVAVLFVFTFATTANHLIFLTESIRKLDYQTIEAAKTMGASQLRIVSEVVLPVLKPTIFALTVLVFIAGMGGTSFSLILGGDDFQTIGPMVLNFSKTASSRDLAALLALMLGAITVILLIIMTYYEKKNNYTSISKVKTKIEKQKIENKFVNILVHIIAYILFFIYVSPLFLVILFSFTTTRTIGTGEISLASFTLENYKNVFASQTSIMPFLNSGIYALAGASLLAIISLVVSRIMYKYKNKFVTFLEYSLLIPWILPKTLIAIALVITFDRGRILLFNSVLSGTIWILLIGYIIVRMPFTIKMLKTAFYTIDDSLEEAAKSLGAGALYTFIKVILPIIIAPTLAVITLNFNYLLTEYDLTVFLYHPLKTPIGIIIQNSIEGGETGTDPRALLLVYSVIIMIISSLTLYFVYGRNTKES